MTMMVLTFQSNDLDLSFKNGNIIYPNGNCNYPHAKAVYLRLFNEYNKIKRTNYKNFFWAFSELLTDDREEQIKRGKEMLGDDATENAKVLILDVPDDICFATDFYGFADEIYAYEYPNELKSLWSNIFKTSKKSETQVIFPYITEEMIVEVIENY